MLRNPPIGSIVLAEWLDSARADGWHRGEPDEEVARCQSAGLLMLSTADVVVIAGHWTNEKERQRCGEMTIPRKALVSLRALK